MGRFAMVELVTVTAWGRLGVGYGLRVCERWLGGTAGVEMEMGMRWGRGAWAMGGVREMW